MATIKAFVRTTRTCEVKIRFRLSDGRDKQFFYTSHIMVLPSLWDNKKECTRKRVVGYDGDRKRVDTAVAKLKTDLLRVYERRFADIYSSDSFQVVADEELYGIHNNQNDFFTLYDKFTNERDIAETTRRRFRGYKKRLLEYEAFRQAKDSGYKLSINMTADDIDGFLRFYNKEKKSIGSLRIAYVTLHSFLNHLYKVGLIKSVPEQKSFHLQPKYGTPYYLTLDERNAIADLDLSRRPRLIRYRDMFIFQCLVGCRVSDLHRIQPNNISDGFLSYIPQKTASKTQRVVRVPLTARAIEIVNRYTKGKNQRTLFPSFVVARYNIVIKVILSLAGINRMVTIYDTTKQIEKQVPINVIASSHMARRTFIGNLYKKVRDPNIIGSMSGHTEGSTAFARYRTIDDEIKLDVISAIE